MNAPLTAMYEQFYLWAGLGEFGTDLRFITVVLQLSTCQGKVPEKKKKKSGLEVYQSMINIFFSISLCICDSFETDGWLYRFIMSQYNHVICFTPWKAIERIFSQSAVGFWMLFSLWGWIFSFLNVLYCSKVTWTMFMVCGLALFTFHVQNKLYIHLFVLHYKAYVSLSYSKLIMRTYFFVFSLIFNAVRYHIISFLCTFLYPQIK